MTSKLTGSNVGKGTTIKISKDLNGLSSWFVLDDKKTGKGENYKTDWNWKEKRYADMLGNRRAT